jgi:hypothetical protein
MNGLNALDPTGLSRRKLLKVGLLGSALLATAGVAASLGGCSADTPASGRLILRDSDLPFLRRVIPVILAGAVPLTQVPQMIAGTLHSIDRALASLSPAQLIQVRQLFDVTSLSLTRGPLTGVWGSWDTASAQQVSDFLLRWRDSPLSLLRQGHGSLLQLVQMAWYSRAESWAHCGYPGPPRI